MVERFTVLSPVTVGSDSDWECPSVDFEIDSAVSTSGYDTDDSWHVLRDSDDEIYLTAHANVSKKPEVPSRREEAPAVSLIGHNKHDSSPQQPHQNPPKSEAVATRTLPLQQRTPNIPTAAARALLFQATRCRHWVARSCHLTSTAGKCCECVDGRGYGQLGAERYMQYCPGCKTSCEAAHESAVKTAAAADLEKLDVQRVRRRQQHGRNRSAVTKTPPAQGVEQKTAQQHQHQHQHQHQKKQRLYTPTNRRECVHWLAYSCALAGRQCCACADKRANVGTRDAEGGYLKYVDGLGDVLGAARWEYYCPGCLEACSEVARREDGGARYVNWLRWKKAAEAQGT